MLSYMDDLEIIRGKYFLKHDPINICYLDELENWIKDNHLSHKDVCLVGSASLAANGIRQNNDLEIAVRPDCYKKLNKKYKYSGLRWNIPISQNVELFRNQFAYIGFLDRDIFKRGLYKEAQGYHVVILELEFLYKKSLKREKDKRDVLKITCLYPEIDSLARAYWIWYKGMFKIWNKISKGISIFYGAIIECTGKT